MRVEAREIGPLAANCYIIDGHIMVDPGDDTGALDAFIADTRADIGAVILTHGHFDHMLGAAHIKRVCGAKIHISEQDEHYLWDKTAAVVFPCANTPFEPLRADEYLKPGENVIDGERFEVLFTPGHTKGGVCVLSRENRLIFTGDTLFKHGYGRTDFEGGDIMALFQSLRTLLSLPEDTYVYPGHGESATLREIRRGYQ